MCDIRMMNTDDFTNMEVEYVLTQSLIDSALRDGNYSNARNECYIWANIVAKKLGFSFNNNWKLFKKNLVAAYFGSTPYRSFTNNPGTISEFNEFKEKYNDFHLRMTIYKNSEACHSKSILLNPGEEVVQFSLALRNLEARDCIVVFPESSGPKTICFRCAIYSFGQDVSFEAGYGQAYLTFENERGLHPVASMEKNMFSQQYSAKGEKPLVSLLQELVEKYGEYLILTLCRICRLLGLDYISIEGYYNYNLQQHPVIIDCDLPFDKVFFEGAVNRD